MEPQSHLVKAAEGKMHLQHWKLDSYTVGKYFESTRTISEKQNGRLRKAAVTDKIKDANQRPLC